MARRSGRRTDYNWVSAAGVNVNVDVGLGTAVLGAGSVAFNGAGTVARVRGQVLINLDATAVNEQVVIALGLIKVDNDALAVGVTAIPKPHIDGDAEWLWHGYLLVTSGSEAAVNNNGLIARLEIDSKAMRRVKTNDNMVLVAEVAAELDQGGNFDLLYGYRLLVGL